MKQDVFSTQNLFLRSLTFAPEKLNLSSPHSYLMRIPALSSLRELIFHRPVTIFCGENGTGKSTLLEALAVACGCNPEGGGRNFQFTTADTHSDLFQVIHLIRGCKRPKDCFFFRSESFYNLATEIDTLSENGLGRAIVESYGGISLHHQSHGESLLSLVQNRFGKEGLYFLDEPEAALSPSCQLTLLCECKRLAGLGSQLIIATHSPILLACPDAQIYEFSDRIRQVSYQETQHFRLYRYFLAHPDRMLHELFSE